MNRIWLVLLLLKSELATVSNLTWERQIVLACDEVDEISMMISSDIIVECGVEFFSGKL